jgi:hypothetical protein
MRFLGRSFFLFLAILIAGAALFIQAGKPADFKRSPNEDKRGHVSTSSPFALGATSSPEQNASSTTATTTAPKKPSAAKKVTPPAPEQPDPTPTADPNAVTRIQNPYPDAPRPFTAINEDVRRALVNIQCSPSSGAIRPITGSGVIIDPRGIILTNAHVAQYVLLSLSPYIDLSCNIRTGSPASGRWKAQVLYIPPVWVNTHVTEITSQRAYGTGEHDYALLYIVGSADGQLPSAYPFVPVDVRHGIGFEGDSILVASYPAELTGSSQALYAVTSVTSIQKLLTFVQQTVDLISLGGIIGAQSGSSGGAVVNAWNRLIGLVVTTSAGDTTGERDLRALTLSYIDRDLAAQTGHNLTEILASDIPALTLDFNEKVVPNLLKAYIDVLTKNAN